ncbi:MAG: DUF3365 domain-containing protein [Proteobacteria bacterium]|nr:DUF3365 domain-containing protein [Pseudomonadota bacterium]MBU1709938.1 DUF3365 domain-containing protein [Pseudomonadota bacterium]
MKVFDNKRRVRRYALYVLLIVFIGNLYALMDLVFYPDVPYLAGDHVKVGGFMASLAIVFCWLLESVSRRGKTSEGGFSSMKLGTYVWILVGFWTIIIFVSLAFNLVRQKQETFEVALNEARTVFEKDLIYYRWASNHNGVFVPITESTQPNPYLKDIPENMINASSGKSYTLVNPEYMIREIYEMQTLRHGVLGHITSLDPIRSENAADEWESQALEAFENGKEEVHSIEKIDGEPYLRLMRPMITEEGCLKCHAPQGYDLGDIRGGISVSVPMTLLFSISRKDTVMFSMAHFALWLLGIMGILIGSHRLQESIREREQAEARIRSIIENMLDGLITLDEDGCIESLNTAATRIFGFDSHEVVGQHIDVLVRFSSERGSKYSAVQETGPPDITRFMGSPQEITGRRKDGSTFPLELSISQMMFGAKTLFIAMARDITEEKIKKAEALRAGQLAAIGEIAAGVAHEINNPINGIINLTQILLDGFEASDIEAKERGEILTRIIKEGDRISGIVRNLLDFARQRDETVEEFQIEDVIRDSVSLLMYQFNKDAISAVIDISPDLPYLKGNPQQLQQVFLNLLSNARYSLKMRYKGQDPGKRLEITSFVIQVDGKDYLRTTVTDFGTGIPKEVIDKIFDPLFSTKPPGEGTGLGLSISQNLVMEHQGYLRFESIQGDHTTAIVDLPIPIQS